MPEVFTEARTRLLVEATGTAGRYLVQLIDPGWGSSGYYSPTVLAEAARDRIFPAGLHMYADHPHADGSGVDTHGNRSVTDLWAVLESDATLDDSGALVAEARVFTPYRDLVDSMRDDIGLSIRAYGSFEMGEAEGRRGQIITSIDEARSVDFVTAAGRGGRIMEMVESAAADGLTETVARARLMEARNVGQWIESRLHLTLTQIADDMFGDGRLTREERISLSSAVGDALQAFVTSLETSQPQLYERDLWADPATVTAMSETRIRLTEATANDVRDALSTAIDELYQIPEQQWAWVRDYDPDAGVVFFDISGRGDQNGTYSQAFAINDDGTCDLTGTRTEVSVRTIYVPVDPAGQSTTESQGGTMPQIEEAEHRRLVEAAGRVQTLESERDAANQRATTAETALAESAARNAARPIVAEVLGQSQTLPPATIARVTESVVTAAPLTTEGRLDEAALRTATEAARTAAETEIGEALAAAGAGKVRGFGTSTAQDGEIDESDYDKRSAGVFNRPSVKGA